jgi:hypothetical protein
MLLNDTSFRRSSSFPTNNESSIVSDFKCKVILRPRAIRPGRLSVRPPSGSSDLFLFHFLGNYLDISGFLQYGTPSPTRGWVCNLWLLRGVTSALCLWFDSRRTHDHTLLSQLRLPQIGGQVPLFVTPGIR